MTYRNPDLLALARLAPCCMSCGKRNEGDVVAAHANWHEYGKGAGLKANDWAVAFLCGPEHAEIDQGARMGLPERKALWLDAHRKTIAWLFEAGHLVVAPEAVRPADEQPKPRPVKRIRKGRKLQSNPKIQAGPPLKGRNDLRRRQDRQP